MSAAAGAGAMPPGKGKGLLELLSHKRAKLDHMDACPHGDAATPETGKRSCYACIRLKVYDIIDRDSKETYDDGSVDTGVLSTVPRATLERVAEDLDDLRRRYATVVDSLTLERDQALFQNSLLRERNAALVAEADAWREWHATVVVSAFGERGLPLPAMPTPAEKRETARQRSAIACERCKKHKIRCTDYPEECPSCLKAGVDCVYTIPNKRGPAKASSTGDV